MAWRASGRSWKTKRCAQRGWAFRFTDARPWAWASPWPARAGIVASAAEPAYAAPLPASEVTTDASTIVETRYGKVGGYRQDGIATFKGIPYAATTAGAARFLPPRPVAAWSGVRSSRYYGHLCPQPSRTGWDNDMEAFLMRWDDGQPGEDCLRLNLWTPDPDSKRRPVMVWLHGGGSTAGSGQELPAYDGEALARKGDLVVVSVNHRLGPLGFLDMSAAGPQFAQSANVGMLDLVAALQWVRDNIAAFGGDPGNVTIFGQSGGGSKVTTLMAMPAAVGLFHKAIVQSGSLKLSATPEETRRAFRAVLSEFDLREATAQRLQEVPAAELIARCNRALAIASGGGGGGPPLPPGIGGRPRLGWSPSVDGKILPEAPFTTAAPALGAKIPMIIGNTKDEWGLNYARDQADMTEAQLVANLKPVFGERTDSVIAAFRAEFPGLTPAQAIGTILSMPMRNNALEQVAQKRRQGGAAVYSYWFRWETPVLGGMPRAFHCSDLPHCFNNAERCATTTGNTPEARQVSAQMSQAWINFARTGNPSQPGLSWPPYDPATVPTMVFDTHSRVENDPAAGARKSVL